MTEIRRAVREDTKYLSELYRQLESDAVMYQPEHFVMSSSGARICDELFDSDTQAVFVAEENGEVIGFVHVMMLESKNVACLKHEKNVYIQDMVVDKEHRSLGTGSLLMDKAKQYGREQGAAFVRTQVFPKNEDGLRFYRRNGFEVTMLTVEVPL